MFTKALVTLTSPAGSTLDASGKKYPKDENKVTNTVNTTDKASNQKSAKYLEGTVRRLHHQTMAAELRRETLTKLKGVGVGTQEVERGQIRSRKSLNLR